MVSLTKSYVFFYLKKIVMCYCFYSHIYLVWVQFPYDAVVYNLPYTLTKKIEYGYNICEYALDTELLPKN